MWEFPSFDSQELRGQGLLSLLVQLVTIRTQLHWVRVKEDKCRDTHSVHHEYANALADMMSNKGTADKRPSLQQPVRGIPEAAVLATRTDRR